MSINKIRSGAFVVGKTTRFMKIRHFLQALPLIQHLSWHCPYSAITIEETDDEDNLLSLRAVSVEPDQINHDIAFKVATFKGERVWVEKRPGFPDVVHQL